MEGKYLETFLSRIVVNECCWDWDGAHFKTGYAETWDGRRPLYAHRVSYELWVGPIPDGFVIDHLCRNRGCVNPEHLEAVSQRTNILRGTGMSARHAVKTHCPKGHEYTAENTYNYPNKNSRECRVCMRERNRINLRNYRARRKAAGLPHR